MEVSQPRQQSAPASRLPARLSHFGHSNARKRLKREWGNPANLLGFKPSIRTRVSSGRIENIDIASKRSENPP
jgi:hypothetical protein